MIHAMSDSRFRRQTKRNHNASVGKSAIREVYNLPPEEESGPRVGQGLEPHLVLHTITIEHTIGGITVTSGTTRHT